MKKLPKIFIPILLVTMFLSFFSVTFAQLEYEMVSYTDNDTSRASTPFFNVALFNQKTFPINYQSITVSFQFLFDLIIGISIATAVIVFMIAAFKEITGRGDVAQVKSGKEGMQNAVIGLMIILSSWLIINTINPDLLRLPLFQGLDSIGATKTSGGGSGATGFGGF